MKMVSHIGDYARIFCEEQANVYPAMDAFEARMGYALPRQKLEDAARVLACPVKLHPPCWQHGRLIYAATRRYLSGVSVTAQPYLLDIGTAKGFSALCLFWALRDAGMLGGTVVSVDVLDPHATAVRNTVAECDGPKTLAEVLAPWPESQAIDFRLRTGIDVLKSSPARVHVAFVDGKHTAQVVTEEGELLAARQRPGDMALFDDCQIDGVQRAINTLGTVYQFEILEVKPERAYAVGVRR